MRLVTFTAPWCQPCKMLKPRLVAFCNAKEWVLEIVDVDEDKDLAAKHRIMSIPTTLLMDGPEVLRRFTGLGAINELEDLYGQEDV